MLLIDVLINYKTSRVIESSVSNSVDSFEDDFPFKVGYVFCDGVSLHSIPKTNDDDLATSFNTYIYNSRTNNKQVNPLFSRLLSASQ